MVPSSPTRSSHVVREKRTIKIAIHVTSVKVRSSGCTTLGTAIKEFVNRVETVADVSVKRVT